MEDEERLKQLKKYLSATLEEFESLVASSGDFDDTRVGNGWNPAGIEESIAVLPSKPTEELLSVLRPTGLHGLTLALRRVRGKSISKLVVKSCRRMYVPFWLVKGFHECYYFRTASYKVPTREDVVAVEVEGSLKNLVLENSRPSSVLEILKMRIDRLAGLIADSPRHFVLDGVTELARSWKEMVLCLDRFGRMDPALELMLRSKPPLHRMKDSAELRRYVGETELAAMEASKETTIKELHKRIVSSPSSFTRILTNRFDVTELSLIYLPVLKVEYSSNGSAQIAAIDAYSGRILRDQSFKVTI